MNILIDSIIRPYRFTYNMIDLGPKNTKQYIRIDDYLTSNRNQKVQYSYYSPKHNISTQQKSNNDPTVYKNSSPMRQSDTCLIYAHCNSGCKIEGLQYVGEAVKKGWNVCLFDFTGSGNSDGKVVTLGENQARDLKDIVEVVKSKGNHKILLWGRSMGAATILFYLGKFAQPNLITGCVLDSPYSDLFLLSKQIASKKTGLPSFIIQKLLDYARLQILQDHHFDIRQMKPINMLKLFNIPLMYITSVKDQFVSCAHVLELYNETLHPNKILEYIDKEHNSARQIDTVKIGMEFLKKCINEEGQIKIGKKQLRVYSKISHQQSKSNNIKWQKKSNVSTKIPINKQPSSNIPDQNINPPNILRRFKSFGTMRDIESIYLRRSYAQGDKQNIETLNESKTVQIPNVISYNLPYKTQTDTLQQTINLGNQDITLRQKIRQKVSISINRNMSQSNLQSSTCLIQNKTSRPVSIKKKIQTSSTMSGKKHIDSKNMMLISFKSEELVPTPTLLKKHKHTTSNLEGDKKKIREVNYHKENIDRLNHNPNPMKIPKFKTFTHQTLQNETIHQIINHQMFPSIDLCQSKAETARRIRKKKQCLRIIQKSRRESMETTNPPFPHILNTRSIQIRQAHHESLHELKVPKTIKLHKRV